MFLCWYRSCLQARDALTCRSQDFYRSSVGVAHPLPIHSSRFSNAPGFGDPVTDAESQPKRHSSHDDWLFWYRAGIYLTFAGEWSLIDRSTTLPTLIGQMIQDNHTDAPSWRLVIVQRMHQRPAITSAARKGIGRGSQRGPVSFRAFFWRQSLH